jgi:hypothetical protein
MTFHDLHGLLIHHLSKCVQCGALTERGLAKRAGISQSHLHNVLKGKRLLSWQTADALLVELHLDLRDLVK